MSEVKINFGGLKRNISLWVKAENGATAVEYALMAVGVAVAISAIVFALGGTVNDDLFTPVLDGF